MKLGAFSVSLNVKDLAVSKAFYHKLGFEDFHDGPDHGYAILKNGDTVIGLFSGMIPENTLTFNPGWDQSAQPVSNFDDIRDIQATLTARDVNIDQTCDPDHKGPAHILLVDPDGNRILIDQHV